jgi:aminoglycoside phosphotransferase (APT) family kinase protein
VARTLGPDIVQTANEAAALSRPPLIILDRIAAFLDEQGLGSGPVIASRVGEGGGSNFSFLIERSGERYVLRRPPRPPLPPSAHDVVREARLQLALSRVGIRVPRIRAVCEDEALLGVPFYLADFIEGFVVTDTLPPGLQDDERARQRLAEDLIDALVEIHAVDVDGAGLAAFVRPGSYLERQVRRFGQLWEVNATRDLPLVGKVGARLAAALPEPLAPAVVHGDYRLGNMIVVPGRTAPIAAVLDWEMGAIGDPRADVGYLLATYSSPDGDPSPLGTSPVTATPGFLTGAELVSRYVERSGRQVEPLAWFEALALWKAAVFCEAIYGRFLRGELTSDDSRAAAFETIVPALAETASGRLAHMKPPA